MSLRISDLQGRCRVVGMHTQHRVPANDVARRCEAGTEAIRSTGIPCGTGTNKRPRVGNRSRFSGRELMAIDRTIVSEPAIELVCPRQPRSRHAASNRSGDRAGQECQPPNLRVGRIAETCEKRGSPMLAAESCIILWDGCLDYYIYLSLVDPFPVRVGKDR